MVIASTAKVRKRQTDEALDSSKFPLLLTRILQKIHLKDERTFSEEEETKLQGVLELPPPDLELIIQTLEFFLHQVRNVYCMSKTCHTIVIWYKHMLEAINWRLNLQMAQSMKTKMKMPNAMFELDVKNENKEDYLNDLLHIDVNPIPDCDINYHFYPLRKFWHKVIIKPSSNQ
ncbi:hypothetical protein KUTeg_017709 [Tegillarca granosa]|uniref:COMM domain-containing protein n=1 Tax=Tegillarca granosa TaxID=220873 RepID=A0ABQ9EI75_TEGGR|nr:hypothetical protein KUTeg_017709 [Tegillarca granosa]